MRRRLADGPVVPAHGHRKSRPAVIQLLIYAAVAAAVAGAAYAAWSGFKDHIGTPYAEAQRVADQAIVDKANAATRTAEKQRDNALGDTSQCKAASEKQSSEVDRWKAQADRNAIAAREATAAASRQATALAPKIADLQAQAAAAPKLQTCEQELGEATKTLRDALRQRRGGAK